jgi:hypothetical protein
MKTLKLLTSGAILASLFSAGAFAGEVSDFEHKMRDSYSFYRSALFYTNAAKPDDAARAMVSFRQTFAPLLATKASPPAHYADDAQYAATLASVDAIAGKATEEIAAGKLTEAHETLEAIRDQIGHLHERNGIIGFSDRMNAYHAEMEAVLGMAPKATPQDLPTISARIAVLSYLAGELTRLPPAEAASDPAFKALAGDVRQSLDKVSAALATADLAAVKAALGGLKAPYSKLFLKFG